jgi:hypothetical protein
MRHPRVAFGSVDRYFVFGPAYAEVLRQQRVSARRFDPAGALCLNEHFSLLAPLVADRPRSRDHDVLFLDQGLYPFNNEPFTLGDALRRLMHALGAFMRAHPGMRLAYMLRRYGLDAPQRQAVLGQIAEALPAEAVVLENLDDGSNYERLLRAEVVLTVMSTMGFEALRLGVKTLFVNFSADPNWTVCPDARFQLEDATADFPRFEAKLLELLAYEMPGVPAVALERHSAFDGRVQERIAALINDSRLPAGAQRLQR